MSTFFDRLFRSNASTSKIEDPEDPRLLKIHAERVIKRDIDGLLAICEYSLQDGHISQEEAESILCWLDNHRACLDTWPASILYDRLRRMLSDGVLGSDEQKDLLSIIMNVARPRTNDNLIVPSLPVNNPAPEVIFGQRNFCFTGVFDFGSRNDCMEVVSMRGGVVAKGVTKKLNYLIIGNIGSEVWKHTSFGTKIAKAVEYRDSGLPIAIIAENHWAAHLR